MTVTILLAALAAQLLPAPGNVRWEQAAEERSGASFIDPASIVREGDVVRFLTRTDRRVDGGDGGRMLVARVAIDCRRRTIGFVEGDAYDESGRFLHSILGGPAVRFEPLPAEPGFGPLFRRVCGGGGGQ